MACALDDVAEGLFFDAEAVEHGRGDAVCLCFGDVFFVGGEDGGFMVFKGISDGSQETIIEIGIAFKLGSKKS